MTPGNTLIPEAVYTVWAVGLGLSLLVFVPLAVVLLHRLWRTARSIQLYTRDGLAAAAGIAGNTGQIGALNDTIATAGSILGGAAAIEQKLSAATGLLARRAGEE